MPNMLQYDAKNKVVTAIIEFAPDAVVEKEGLVRSSIENHLWTQAAGIAQRLAQVALKPVTEQDVEDEAAEAKAKIDAEAAVKKASVFVSDVADNVKSK